MLPDDSRHLTPQQLTAIERLLLGATITEAAQAAGVSRQTVSEWSNHHWPFQSELSKRRAQALRDVQQRLEEAAVMAVEVLAQIAADPAQPAGVRIKASVALLARCGCSTASSWHAGGRHSRGLFDEPSVPSAGSLGTAASGD